MPDYTIFIKVSYFAKAMTQYSNARAYFSGKRITLMGLGLLGRGIGDAEYLASCGADLLITDLETEDVLAPSLARLAKYPNVRYTLGRHELSDFRNRDLVVKGAGVPTDSPYVIEAHHQGIPVRMSADLFAELSGVPIIGVTGTRGKTTTACLIKAILDHAQIPALLGGNIRGVSTLALLDHASTAQFAVLELDSWQLRGFRAQEVSPRVAVFTTFYPDHLRYYHNDLDAYLADKAAIFLNQRPDDALIVGPQALPVLGRAYPDAARRAICAQGQTVEGWSLRTPGTQYRDNAACAREAALALGIHDDVIRPALQSFAPVSGRLELVRVTNGISIYNDAMAVIPEATIAAIKALSGQPLILIMGGGEKGNAMQELVAQAKRHAKRVVLLTGSGTQLIKRHFPDALVHATLEAAVADALSAAVPGDTVLFSPALSSRGMFRDAYDRNDRFIAALPS